jgi:hypothetical protein
MMSVAWKLRVPALVALVGLAASCHRSSNTDAEHHHELNLPPVGAAVTVSLGGKPVSVDLSTMLRDGDADSVPLPQILAAAFPAENSALLHFDLVGSDGFRPTSRPKCPRLLTGDEIAHFALNVATHDVTLDDKIVLPGCYRVKAVVAVEASR